MKKYLTAIIICCLLFGYLSFSLAQGGMPKMKTSKRDPSGVWKGIADVKFEGKIIDSQTGKDIQQFIVCEIINGVPVTGQLTETGGKTIDIGPQNVVTKDGIYQFTLYIATLNGQTYIRGSKSYRTVGPPSDSLTIRITSDGYEDKIIVIPKDQILVGQINRVDIGLLPLR